MGEILSARSFMSCPFSLIWSRPLFLYWAYSMPSGRRYSVIVRGKRRKCSFDSFAFAFTRFIETTSWKGTHTYWKPESRALPRGERHAMRNKDYNRVSRALHVCCVFGYPRVHMPQSQVAPQRDAQGFSPHVSMQSWPHTRGRRQRMRSLQMSYKQEEAMV